MDNATEFLKQLMDDGNDLPLPSLEEVEAALEKHQGIVRVLEAVRGILLQRGMPSFEEFLDRLTKRAKFALIRRQPWGLGVANFDELLQHRYEDILEQKNCGNVTYREIVQALDKLGLVMRGSKEIE